MTERPLQMQIDISGNDQFMVGIDNRCGFRDFYFCGRSHQLNPVVGDKHRSLFNDFVWGNNSAVGDGDKPIFHRINSIT
jgi:hypothetical protein